MAHSDKGQNRKRITFTLLGMSCTTCAAIIGKALENKPGIYEINVSYLMDTVYIDTIRRKLAKKR